MASDLHEQLRASLGPAFRIEREMGGGGMSRVFLATDVGLDRAVVVKVLSPEQIAGVSPDRFRREIQLTAKLQHPHIVPILSAGTADGLLYYVMPYIGGESLRARMLRDGPLPVDTCARILREVLDALSFAHAHGVVHRDIKPENVLLEAGHAVVADFGVAKALRESGSVTSAGVALGTPTYMAPEQASGDPALDHRSDLYAVGVTAFEMLTGTPPFTGSPQQVITAHLASAAPSVRDRRSDVPMALAHIVTRALEKDPAHRPNSASEMLAAIDAAVAVTTPQPGARPNTREPRGRFPLFAGVVSAVVVALGAAAAWRFTRPPVIASAQSMAIAPFAVSAGDTLLVRLGQNLVTTISANLDGVGDIRMADGVAVLSHARAKGPMLSAADGIAIARSLGARSVVHGTLVPTADGIRADAVLYDVAEPQQPVARVTVTGPRDGLAVLTDSLTFGILRAVWNRGAAPTPNVGSITTRSPTALREFLDGERLFARSGPLQAADAYKRAIAADTAFWFAYYRYRVARAWVSAPLDTILTNRLAKHLRDLPERERELVLALDSSSTLSDRLQRSRRLTTLYPDMAIAWVALADFLTHSAPRIGHDIREAIEPWEAAVRLMPSDLLAADHLTVVLSASGELDKARRAFARYDSLVRQDPAPLPNARHARMLQALALTERRETLVDSLLRVISVDSLELPVVPPDRIMAAPVLAQQPGAGRDWDALLAAFERRSNSAEGRRVYRILNLSNRALRGAWASVDTALGVLNEPIAEGGPATPYLLVRARVLAELQGLLPPDRRMANNALAIAATRGLRASTRVEGHWIAGASALVNGDTTTLNRELALLVRDTTPAARIAVRSLRAIALGRAGNHRVAAESLLVLEREHGEYAPKVWGAFGADRILAAQWLFEDRRYEAADSLLRYMRSFMIGAPGEAAWPTFSLAQLQRARIADALRHSDDAVLFATMFLDAFDLAPPSQRALIDDALDLIRRNGGRLDEATRKPVR